MAERTDLFEIMKKYPNLTTHGFGIVSDYHPMNVKYQHELVQATNELRTYSLKFVATVDWIQENLRKGNKFDRSRTSYGLKHTVEKFTGYIPNGLFIAAMLYLEYEYELNDNIHVQFKIDQKSIREAEKLTNYRSHLVEEIYIRDANEQ